MARLPLRDRQEQLLAAALRVMVRDGVDAATTRAIVAEAGMTLGSFHYCFDSREVLLREVATRLTDERVAAARAAFAHGRDLKKSIKQSLKAFWQGVEDDPGAELVGFELTRHALRQPVLHELAQHQYAHYLQVHEDFLVAAAQTASIVWIVPVKTLARYVHVSLDGLSMCWLVDRDSEQSRRILDLIADYLVSCTRPAA